MFGIIRLAVFAGVFALVISTLLIGWPLGESGSDNRKTIGFPTSVRNVVVSLVIATGSFPGTPAVTPALAYGIFQTLALALVALAWGRFEIMRASIPDALNMSPSGSDQIFEKTRP